MKRKSIQPVIDDAKSRRAETPADGMLIHRALEASERAQSSPRHFGSKTISFVLVGTMALGIGFYKLSLQCMDRALPHVAKTTSQVAKAVPHVAKSKASIARVTTNLVAATNHAAEATNPIAEAVPHVASDDLEFVNMNGSEAAIQHWAQLPQDEQTAQQERIKAIVKGGDDFIDVPLPMIATTTTTPAAEALAAYQADRQIVDGRLAQGVTLGTKALSFTDLCAELTRKTGVTFTAAPSVADDKVTIFCTKRPVRDLMREITNLFGFTWNRSGQPDEYSYRLTQPVKAQLAEQELRNKSNNLVVFNSISRMNIDVSGEYVVLEGVLMNNQRQATGELVFVPSNPPAKLVERPTVTEVPASVVSVTGRAMTSEEGKAATPTHFEFRLTPPTNNAERNKALKPLPELTKRVTIAPVPGEREPRLPGESAPPSLVTTAELLEAIHNATGKDVIGDAFTHLEAPARVTAKNLPLFDALNTVCEPVQLQWGHARGFFQFRSASFYNDRPREVPNRLLNQWALSRRMNQGLGASDLAQIALLHEEQLDSNQMEQGAKVLHNLQEWSLATNPVLRLHWRFFASLTPEQQKNALTPEGLAFKSLRQAQQWELLRLAFEKKDNVASVATQLDTIRLCVERTRFVYRYTRPDGTASEVVFAATP